MAAARAAWISASAAGYRRPAPAEIDDTFRREACGAAENLVLKLHAWGHATDDQRGDALRRNVDGDAGIGRQRFFADAPVVFPDGDFRVRTRGERDALT